MMYIAPDVFYYWLIDDENYGERATQIIMTIERKTKAVTSVQTLVQLDRRFAGQPNYSFAELLNRLNALKYLKLAKLDDDFEDILRAMELFSLDIENAIHFATAKDYKCETIFTNEPSLSNTTMNVTTL